MVTILVKRDQKSECIYADEQQLINYGVTRTKIDGSPLKSYLICIRKNLKVW